MVLRVRWGRGEGGTGCRGEFDGAETRVGLGVEES